MSMPTRIFLIVLPAVLAGPAAKNVNTATVRSNLGYADVYTDPAKPIC
jgi:hypothetical protein